MWWFGIKHIRSFRPMKMKRLVSAAILSGLVIGFSPRTAHAWNKAGHMVIAAIAYRDLQRTDNQAVIDKVVNTLKRHPDFETRFAPRLADVIPDDRDMYLFMLAARWADDIRKQSPLDDPPAHYIDYPFVPPGLSGIETAPPASNNLVSKFKKQVDIIKASDDDAEEAKALTWLLHLIGDSHMPLHAVSMFTRELKAPDGDRGGNEIFVKVRPDSDTINLHFFWDGLVIGTDRFQATRSSALGLIGRPELARSTFSQLSNTTIDSWIDESFQLAKSDVYKNGEIRGSGNRENGAVLPADYPVNSKRVAERQVVLSGYRMADLLKALAPAL
jgi:S1/P1 Nuclease